MYRFLKTACLATGLTALLLAWHPLASHADDATQPIEIQQHRAAMGTLHQVGLHDAAFWNTGITSLPLALNYPAVAVGHDGNIYVFGGSDTQTRDTTFIYHPGSNTWTQGTPMLAPREAAQAVTLRDGRIAVIGGNSGCDTCIYNTTFIYTPRTNSWIEAASMATARQRFGAVLGHDGRVYAIGGWDGARAEATAEAYDPVHNAWAPVAGLPLAEEGNAAVTDRDGDIVVLGGFNGQEQANFTYFGNVFVYTHNAWKSAAALPTPREDLAATLGPDGQIYAIGGYNSQQWVATVEVYNPATGSWSSVTSLPSARCCLAAVAGPAGHIYAFGGAGSQVAVYEPIPSVPAPAPQAQLTVALPGQNAVLTGRVLPFTWHAYRHAVYYDLQIWLVQAAKGQALTTHSVTNYAVRLKGTSYGLSVKMMPKGVYQWRMAATNAQGALISSWTPVGTVTIAQV